jgi:hypothetical protein
MKKLIEIDDAAANNLKHMAWVKYVSFAKFLKDALNTFGKAKENENNAIFEQNVMDLFNYLTNIPEMEMTDYIDEYTHNKAINSANISEYEFNNLNPDDDCFTVFKVMNIGYHINHYTTKSELSLCSIGQMETLKVKYVATIYLQSDDNDISKDIILKSIICENGYLNFMKTVYNYIDSEDFSNKIKDIEKNIS